MDDQLFCAHQTRLANDPLFGTATEARVWVLLQYDGPWRAKATADNELPAAVQARLEAEIMSVPGARLQFISRETTAVTGPLKLFVGVSDGPQTRLYEFESSTYESLLGFNLRNLVDGDALYDRQLRSDPLILVCTNGKRDKCCALFGLPLYATLQANEGADVWRTTHLGGHRYAPTMLMLPHGLIFGLVDEANAAAAVAAYREGRIFNLERFRGRSSQAPPVQAADYFLRQELGIMEVDDLNPVAVEELEGDCWVVEMAIKNQQVRSRIVVQRSYTSDAVVVSCNEGKTKPVVRYERKQ